MASDLKTRSRIKGLMLGSSLKPKMAAVSATTPTVGLGHGMENVRTPKAYQDTKHVRTPKGSKKKKKQTSEYPR